MQNHLKDQTSPYLLQHVNNPVDWYPWGEEAFEKAKAEDKPVFLSIGYSTCHWCHVMAHESFEDGQIAEILNRYFISVKVDKEERPDVDSIYMAVCQAITGSGGWPTSIFMTPDQKPFFAGTYFPKTTGRGMIGLRELLMAVHEKWEENRDELIKSADEIIAHLEGKPPLQVEPATDLIHTAVEIYKQIYDKEAGGFGRAPKFPTPHNLLFLLKYYEMNHDKSVLEMVEKTLLQMYKGGMFDHIGGGFCRYSTDRYFLAPHFEKMLYDNALLILAYCKAFEITKQPLYLTVAEKTADYVLREMTGSDGEFYSAQDADSEGEEGKYYLFEPNEITKILGKETAMQFNQYFDITEHGNFEGKNIPNLLNVKEIVDTFESYLPLLYEYRKKRYELHLDDKVLTSWNGLMIAAMCYLYRVSENKRYLEAAKRAQSFIENHMWKNKSVFVSYRKGRCGVKGFVDEYAHEMFALLALYDATLERDYLEKVKHLCEKVISVFWDEEHGGVYLYGDDNEQLILRPKETYDGAIPSGNSMMAYNLVQLALHTGEKRFKDLAESQIGFMSAEAEKNPSGYAMFLLALCDYVEMSENEKHFDRDC